MPPANDNLADFQALTGQIGTVDGTTVDATTDTPYDPILDFDFGRHTVWYRLACPDEWVTGFSKLTLNFTPIDTPGRSAVAAYVYIFQATTYPPTSDSDWDFMEGTYTEEATSLTYVGDAPTGGFFYFGVGDNGLEADPSFSSNFTLSWFIAHSEPRGICVAFESDTLDTQPEWVRLDGSGLPWSLTGFDISRGRQSELDKTGTGTATLSLIDLDGSFDPTNPSGPFYGLLDPLKQAKIMVQNPVTDEWRTLFTGFVAEFPADLYKTGDMANLELELVDGFAILAGVEMMPTFGDDKPDDYLVGDIFWEQTGGVAQVRGRLAKALDQAGWPTLWRHLFSGNVGLQEVEYARGEPILTVLLDCADAEFPGVANILVGRRGEIIFRGRYARFNPEAYEADDDDIREGPAGTGGRLRFWKAGGRPQAEADPGTALEGYRDGTAVISDISWRRGIDDVINNAIATPKDVEEEDVPDNLVTDPTSIALYGWRSGPDMGNLLVERGNTPPGYTAVAETQLMAQYYVDNGAPRTRITRLDFGPRDARDTLAGALWALICGVEIGDGLNVDTTHFVTGGFDDDDYFIEGIRYHGEPGRPDLPLVSMSLDVSPRGFYSVNPWGTTVDDEVPAE